MRGIRKQPKPMRDNIAMVVAGLFTAAVFVVWLYHMPARNAVFTERESDKESVGFSHLMDQVGSQLSAVKDSVTVEPESEPESEVITPVYTEEERSSWALPGDSAVSVGSSTTATSSIEEDVLIEEVIPEVVEQETDEINHESTTAETPRIVRIVSVPEATSTTEEE